MLLALAVACRSPETTKPEPATSTPTETTPSTESLDTTTTSSGSAGTPSTTADTSGTTPTGGPWDGHYTGLFAAHIVGVDSTGATVADQTCPGALDLVVLEAGSPMIQGSFDCAFTDGTSTKPTPVSLRGDLASGGDTAGGDLLIGESGSGLTPISETTWTGSFLVADTGGAQPSFSATFVDNWAVKGITFDLDGTAAGTRDP